VDENKFVLRPGFGTGTSKSMKFELKTCHARGGQISQ